MKTITLTNLRKMPAVGLGTWQVQDPLELKYAMEAAFECGYRHFDTAFLYKNENILGKVTERWLSKGLIRRDELFITTKLPFAGVHSERVELFLDKSLKNLSLDYVDLYLIHFPVCVKFDETNDVPMDETGKIITEDTDLVSVWKKMEEMVIKGKTKAIGLSNFNINQITRILKECTIKPANLQIEAHVYFQNKDLIKFCKNKGISITAYSPLGSPGINQFYEQKGLPIKKELLAPLKDEKVLSIAAKYSRSPGQVLLRFLIQKDLAVIPKSTNPKRIKENIDLFDFSLDEEDMACLENLDKGEDAKVCDCKGYKGLLEHPEFPFNK